MSDAHTGTVYWQPRTNAGFPAMNARGQIEAYVLGGGLDVERLHDAATGAVTSITSGPGGSGNVLNLTTGYNDSGSRLTLNDLNAGLYESYSYDNFQRLMGVTRTASGGGSSSSYSYYAAGQFNQGPVGTYHYDNNFPKHSPSSTTQNGTTTDYTYDQDGDRTAARLPAVTWNALGKAHTITPQSGATPIYLTYGPDGGLVNTTSAEGGRYFGAWLKWQDSSDWSARIIVQGRAIAVVKDSAGSVNTRYLLRGPLGSTQAVATGSGSLTQRIAYGAWGRFVQPATGTGTSTVNVSAIAQATTVTYTGHELIAGTGLINMGARLYDPATGLFMSPDPTVAHPYDTQDLNQFAYVEDNPVSFTDPSGYETDLSKVVVNGSYWGSSMIIGTSITVNQDGGGGGHRSGRGRGSSKQSKKNPCGKQSQANSPNPVIRNRFGLNRAFNPNLQKNTEIGAGTGAVLGAGVATFVFINIVGFPEVEAGEAGVAGVAALLEPLHVMTAMGTFAMLGGGVGAVPGGAAGYLLTQPKPLRTPSTGCSK